MKREMTSIQQMNQGTQKQRILSIDVLKSFAIFLVIWGHAIQHLTTNDCIENAVYRWIYSFHMPLFMMVSGFFSLSSMKLGLWPFLGKKLKQIALPGFTWPWVFTLIGVMVWGHTVHLSFNPLRYIPYWFLWALLTCNMLAYVGNRIKYGRAITLLISQLIPFANVIYMYPAFVFGQVISENKEYFIAHLKQIVLIAAMVYFVSFLFWGADDWHLLSQTKDMVNTDGYLRAGLFYAGKTTYKLIVNLSGGLFFFCIFVLSESLWNNAFGRFLGVIGKYTLIFYILQSFVLESTLPRYINLDCLSRPAFTLIVTPSIAIGVLLLCVIVALLVDNNRYTRLLFLGR